MTGLPRLSVIVVTLATGIVLGRYLWPLQSEHGLEAITHDGHEHGPAQATYICPMHADVLSDQPGTCPICGMALVQARPDSSTETAEPGERPAVRISPDVAYNLGVKTAPVARTTLVRRIETPGFVQQIQPAQVKRVTAPFAARIVEIRFTPGQWLETGQPLVLLESETLRSAEQAHLTLLAQQQQGEPDSAAGASQPPDTETEPATSPVTLAQSRRHLQQLGLTSEDIQRLEQTGEASAQLTLFTPDAVQVLNPRLEAGATVEQGDLLFELAGMARATVLANAFQRDAAWIQTGHPVEVRLPHVTGETWSGIVNQGAVSIDPTSQNIGVRLSFSAPPDVIKSGMYVVAAIHGERREGALAVPREAIIHTEAEDRVVVARGEGRFQPVAVRTGIETGGRIEILEGLEEGEQVVVSAQFLIDSESSLQASFMRMY